MGSEVLSAFEVLGDKRFRELVWERFPVVHRVMLPLVCKQLRSLCQRAVKEICLDADDCRQLPGDLSSRFPNCCSVQLRIVDVDDLPLVIAPALPTIARYGVCTAARHSSPHNALLIVNPYHLMQAAISVVTSTRCSAGG